MIDFRYLLTTIVSIFLALAIGLLIGSGLLAEGVARDRDKQVDELVERNIYLRDRLSERERRIEADDEFERLFQERLVERELTGDPIVLMQFEGTDGAVIDRLREVIELADGSVATMITINNRMSMEDTSVVEDLVSDLPAEVATQEDAGAAIAAEFGAAAASESSGAAGASFASIADPLVEHGFIDIETERDLPIPFGADFIVAAGAEGERPYDLIGFSEPFLRSLSSGVAEVVAVEGWTSEWDFVPELRGTDARDSVSTVDHGDTVAGAVSVVLELDRIPANDPGHYGFRDGADRIAPESFAGD